MGTYENPKRVDTDWNKFLDAQKFAAKQISSVSESARKNAYEKKSQGKLYDDMNSFKNKSENFQQNVTELSSKTSGNANFDDNVRMTFQNESDALYRAAKELDMGNITHEQYRSIENDAFSRLKSFQAALPTMVEQGTEWNNAMSIEPGNYGSVSSTTPTEAQIVMDEWAKQGNVQLNFDGNNPILFVPGQEEGTGSMINLNNVTADAAKGKDFVNIIDDYSKTLTGAYDNIFQPKNESSKFISTYYEEDPNDPTKEIAYKTITKDGRDKGIQAMIDMGQFDALVANNRVMKMIWQDQMPDELTGDFTWGATDPDLSEEENAKILGEQNEKATRWLAEKAFDENATQYLLGKKSGSRKKQNTVITPANGAPAFEVDDITTLLVDLKDNPSANASKLINKKVNGEVVTDVDYDPETGELVLMGSKLVVSKDVVDGEEKITEETVNSQIGSINLNDTDNLLNFGKLMHTNDYGGDKDAEEERKRMKANFERLNKVRQLDNAILNNQTTNSSYSKWATSNPLPDALIDRFKAELGANPNYQAAQKTLMASKRAKEDIEAFEAAVLPIEKMLHTTLMKDYKKGEAEKQSNTGYGNQFPFNFNYNTK